MFSHIIRYDWLLLRANRTLLASVALLALFVALAFWTGYDRVRFQQQTIANIGRIESESIAKNRALVAELERTGKPFAGNSHRDPTAPYTVASSRGNRYLAKQPEPLAVVSVGQSDLKPYYYKFAFAKKQALYHEEEIENASTLYNGSFDLSFVLIYLLPLLIIALTYNLVSSEREQGTLFMLMSSTVSLRQIVVSKYVFRFLLLTGAFLALTVAGLILTGVSLIDNVPAIGFLFLLSVGYSAFWFSLSFWVNSAGRDTGFNAATLVGVQGDQFNFRRLQFGGGGMLSSKLGVYVGGYLSDQKNGWRERSDYTKNAVNVKAEYQLSPKTRLTGAYAYNDYRGQEGLSFDSTAFYSRSYETSQDFMYRNVKAIRSRLTLDHAWNANSETFVTAFHRYNDYRFAPNHTVRWKTGANTATSEKQRSIFNSYGLIAQHTQRFNFMNAKLLVGGTYDDTPTRYNAFSIDLAAETRPDGRSVKKYTFLKDRPDVLLGDYEAKIHNTGLYSQFEFNPLKSLRVTAGLRYDRMSFDYENYLDKKSGTKAYQQFSPKVGVVYDLGGGRGLYANYGRGFAPPGLTAIFRLRPSVQQVAGQDPFYYNLEPAHFENMEVGGWFSAFENKLYADISVYRLNGKNELLSVRQVDNSTDYQSVGQTLHQGVEFGLTYKPSAEWLVRVGGANALHRFEDFQLSVRQADAVKNLSGREMPSAPRWIVNTEVFYKPRWLKGFRVAAEWQRLTPFYLNQINTVRYDDKGAFGARGVSVVNTRIGYERRGIEVFVNVLNLTNELYIASASRGNNATDRTNFSPSAPRTVGLGIQYTFAATARQTN